MPALWDGCVLFGEWILERNACEVGQIQYITAWQRAGSKFSAQQPTRVHLHAPYPSSVTNTTLLVTYNRIYITMTKLAETPSVGFDFSNYARNQFLGQRLQGIPKGNTFYLISSFTLTSHSPATSTGTTIVGVIYGGGSSGEEPGVCLGADTRATGGPIVADKNCEKVSGIYGLR